MKHYPTQQLDQRPASFWQLCVLLLLLNSLAFISWVDFRQAPISGNSGFVGEFNQIALANHRDHFRSLLSIKKLPTPDGSDDDLDQHWLVNSTVLNLPVLALIQAIDLHYLTLSVLDNSKFNLPLTRAPPLP